MKAGTLWELAFASRILHRCETSDPEVERELHAMAARIQVLSAQLSDSGRPAVLTERDGRLVLVETVRAEE